jgi:hypothetical protein
MREHCEHECASEHGIQRQHDTKKRMPSVPLHDLPIQAKFTSVVRRQLALEPSLRVARLDRIRPVAVEALVEAVALAAIWRQRHFQLSPTLRANDYALDMKGAPEPSGKRSVQHAR